MMRTRTIKYILAWLFLLMAGGTAMAQDVFNPDNPPEPQAMNRIQVVSSPADAGYVSGAGQYTTGTTVTIRTSKKSNDYTFSHWLENGEVCSDQMVFTYVVGSGNKVFTAVYDYDPQSPDEPTMMINRHIYLNSNPDDACSFNRANGQKAKVGESVSIRAYANQGFVFKGWYRGNDKLSDSNPFNYTVADEDVTLTAHYEFDPDNPTDPQSNQENIDNIDVLPMIFHDEGTYNEALTIAIQYPKADAEIYYNIGDGYVKYTEPFTISETTSIEAYALRLGVESKHVAKTFIINQGHDGPSVENGYYSIKNIANGKYLKLTGIKSVEYVSNGDSEAGSVIQVKATDGKVEVLRAQGIDLPQSISRAIRYIPDVVSLVVEKFNLSGPGTLLGTTGVDKIMEKFNQSVDFNLYLEDVGSSMYRIYGKTPSMAPVVNFYIENKEKADIKLAGLEQAINDAIGKVVDKAGIGESLKNSFSLHMVWERIANDELTEPVDEETKLAFLQEVLSSEQHAWQFAYQTAMFYMEFVEEKQQFQDLMNGMPEYSQYWERIKDIRPGVRFYLIQEGDGMGIAREDKVDNNGCEVWQLEERNAITVRFPTANKANGKYYTTLYTDFGYTLPDGVRALKVTDIDSYGIATAEVIGTQVAAQCPVLLESNTAGDIDITITDIAGALEGNVLVGNDYLVNQYGIYNPTIASLFEAAQGIFGETTYNKYLKEYEHLRFRNAGMVGNKYFLGLDEDDLEKCVAEDGSGERHCVARALGVQDGRLGFYEDWSSNENKSFLVTTKFESIYLRIIGDVNRDGFITIADVTALVNIILGKDNVEPYAYDHYAADVNGDGSITIPDVTALVNIILGK